MNDLILQFLLNIRQCVSIYFSCDIMAFTMSMTNSCVVRCALCVCVCVNKTHLHSESASGAKFNWAVYFDSVDEPAFWPSFIRFFKNCTCNGNM